MISSFKKCLAFTVVYGKTNISRLTHKRIDNIISMEKQGEVVVYRRIAISRS